MGSISRGVRGEPGSFTDEDWLLFEPPEHLEYSVNNTDGGVDDDEAFGVLPPLIHVTSHSDNNFRNGDVSGVESFNSAGTTPTQGSFVTPARPDTSFRTFSPQSNMATTSNGPPVSPSSSPRLPSPPPFTEVQIGPKSPTVGESVGKDKLLSGSNRPDDGATRRIRPGTKAADMASGPPLVPLAQVCLRKRMVALISFLFTLLQLDSPFQLQEHLKALYHHHTKPPASEHLVPITRDVAMSLATPPDGVERSLWLYELCRFLTMKANNLIIAFFAENPPCSSQTCPEMRASEWQYLCAVHDPPKSCCAIDYCCHTLDWATNILTSPKYFPSRLTLGSEAAGGPQASMRHLTNIFRRVYRIFAHAWFQHRGVFWQVEGHDGLYIFFKTVCDAYNLIPDDNYTIPPEAEGVESNMETPVSKTSPDLSRLSLLRKPGEPEGGLPGFQGGEDLGVNTPTAEQGDPTNIVSTGATTRRHKHTPSTGSSVATIAEGPEEEEFPKANAAEDTADARPASPKLPEALAAKEEEGPVENGAEDKDALADNMSNLAIGSKSEGETVSEKASEAKTEQHSEKDIRSKPESEVSATADLESTDLGMAAATEETPTDPEG